MKPLPALLISLVLACAALATSLYLSWYRPDQQVDSSAAAAVVAAAREATVALLTYAPGTVDSDLAAAESHLTGDFLSYFQDFARKVVAPASKQKALKTTADVVGAAVVDMHPNSALVLVFVNQTSTSKERPDPTMTASSVQVSLAKVDANWLVDKFDPV